MKTRFFCCKSRFAFVQTFFFISLALGIAEPLVAAADDLADQISRAHLFPQPLVWVGANPPSQNETMDLWEAAGLDPSQRTTNTIAHLEDFVSSHPGSLWTPSLEANLAYYYRSAGRYTLALEHWESAWKATQQFDSSSGKLVADFTLANWSQLLASLGHVEQLEQLFAATKDRRLNELRWEQLWIQSQNALITMKQHPEISYRCGSIALMNVAETMSNAPSVLGAFLQAKSPNTGFSMSSLVEMAAQGHLDLAAVRRTSGDDLVVPSVIHWKQDHYAAIVARRRDFYLVKDQTFGWPLWMSGETINAEASGDFLIPSPQMSAKWRRLSRQETDSIFGKGMNSNDPPPPPPHCPQDGQSSCDCHAGPPPPPPPPPPPNGCSTCRQGRAAAASGMPSWEVSEPEISLWLDDQPMGYQTSIGEFALKLSYHQRETRPILTNVFSLGPDWNCNWLSYLDVTSPSGDTNFSDYSTTLYGAKGGQLVYSYSDTTSEYRTHTTLQRILDGNNNLTGFQQSYANGSQAIYGLLVNVSQNPLETLAFMTRRLDAQGRPIEQFIYNTNNNVVLLTAVVDFDGHTNSVQYGNANFAAQITEIDNPYVYKVKFKYDQNGMLTNLVDVAGIMSSFSYDNSYGVPIMTNLITPYGPTSFAYTEPIGSLYGWTDSYEDNGTNDNINRAILVTAPDGGKSLYLYRDESGYLYRNANVIQFLPYCYCPNVPGGIPVVGLNSACDSTGLFCYTCNCNNPNQYDGICDHNMFYRNSFYWGPRQYALLSTTAITNLTTADYNLARLRNWLHTNPSAPGAGLSVSETLTMERDPSPDGIAGGQMTWYGYTGKTAYYHYEGTNTEPAWIARVLPDGTTRYTYFEYNPLGNPTLQVETYSAGQTVALRTNTYVYANNEIDLLQHIRPDSVIQESYGYDNNHDVLTMTDALSEVTSYTYNVNEQLTGITRPNGLVTTNIYGTGGFLATTYDYAAVGGSTFYYDTNSYTYFDGQINSHTDARGLTVTNSWDALQRLTNVIYPDGTTTSYMYSNLDLIEVIDRMGFTNSYVYDSMRRMTNQTDALGRSTVYSYCTCGSLESVRDAAGNLTYFNYDDQGRGISATYADNYSVIYNYNLLGQITNTIDSGGYSVMNWYNNQGLPTASSNNIGLLHGLAYDIGDRVTNSIDANSVSLVMTYDNLNRLLTCSYPDNGVEGYGYTLNVPGLTSYTNQIGKVTLYGYDLMNRKTNEIALGVSTNQFAYNGAGDLLTLTDGNGDKTSWNYDPYGRATNKLDNLNNILFVYGYDPDNRLTNRWTPARTNTVYKYDAVGNLTNVVYPVSSNIVLRYDVLNRLTNLVDGVGTTVYGYDAVGQLLNEVGPWPYDTVNYAYQNRLRMSMNIQAPNADAWAQNYGYDSARRLKSITSPAGAFGYVYDPTKLQRVDKLSLPNGAYITNTLDSVARLTGTWLMNSSGVDLDSYVYTYDPASERTNVVRTAGDYNSYTYDNIGELTSAIGREPAGTVRIDERLYYAYDAAGNLLQKKTSPILASQVVYGMNSLNEITNSALGYVNPLTGWSATLSVSGSTTSPATNVTVNGANVARYGDNAFAWNFLVTNGLNTFNAIAQDVHGRTSTTTSSVNVIVTNYAYSYDLNGNLLADGMRNFAYDDENQLISVWKTNAWRNDFAYDGKMRRRLERDYSWNGSSWLQTNEVHYVYDGNLVVQERNANNLPLVTYTRGNDLSGSLQGVGGIGGLLARTDRAQVVPWVVTPGGGLPGYGTHSYYHADGNGNITMLISASQMIVAKYLYDPYGNTLAQGGLLADVNTYRFSSKEWNGNSGLYYYLYRFYDPNLQRWLNRDPISDTAFPPLIQMRIRSSFAPPSEIWLDPNLYDFVTDDPVDDFDILGLRGGHPGPRPSGPMGTPPNHPINPYKRPHPPSAPYCCNTSFNSCMNKCFGFMNPWWAGLISGAIGFGGGLTQSPPPTFGPPPPVDAPPMIPPGSISTGIVWAGGVLGAWAIGTAAGCAAQCGADSCSMDGL